MPSPGSRAARVAACSAAPRLPQRAQQRGHAVRVVECGELCAATGRAAEALTPWAACAAADRHGGPTYSPPLPRRVTRMFNLKGGVACNARTFLQPRGWTLA